MAIVLTGSGGFIGRALKAELLSQGVSIKRLVRTPEKKSRDSALWNPDSGYLEPQALEHCRGIVHLAGENIAARRWNEKQKKHILDSRVQSAKLLIDAVRNLDQPPQFVIAASAIGFYGDCSDSILTEADPAGGGFLANTAQAVETVWRSAELPSTRLVLARIGVVLHPDGGALKKMLLPFQLGLGGPIGPGTQWMSWISRRDAVRALLHIINDERIRGPVNIVSPNPATNKEFSQALAEALKRPAVFWVPSVLARIAFGEMARETVLASTRVAPSVLLDSGFTFEHDDLDSAFSSVFSEY